jgi:hypothetical protein
VEVRQPRVRVGHDQMEVVREHAEGVDLDVEAVRGDGEDVAEDVVRLLRGPEEEAALGAAAGDEVGGPRKDLSCPRWVDQCVGAPDGSPTAPRDMSLLNRASNQLRDCQSVRMRLRRSIGYDEPRG